MSDSIKEKASAFLNWYKDLYGEAVYIDPDVGIMPVQAFHQEIADCQKCALGASRTKLVFGSGNPNAEIMFIGEAPGHNEDLEGMPFVGRSGKLLSKMLGQLRIDRTDVYIANILKCRPPENRDPLPAEVATCIPYLHKQIKLIQPKVLIALGRVAGQNLLETKTALGTLRKAVHEYQNIPLFVTFHPAYILRNNNAMPDGVSDLQRAIDHYKRMD